MGIKLSRLQGYLDSGDALPRVPEGMAVAWFSLTALESGGRLENQDNLLIIDAAGKTTRLEDQRALHGTHARWPAGRVRLAVLDGMGGHADGRQVAEVAARCLSVQPAFDSPQQMEQDLDTLHEALRKKFTDRSRQPGCTLTLLELPNATEAWLYHVGDSRLYALPQRGVPTCLTVDHVPATRAAVLGLLGEAEWRQAVHGRLDSAISQAFVLGNALTNPGAGLSPKLIHLESSRLPTFLHGMDDCRSIPLHAGSRYLLATDGLWHVADPACLIDDVWPEVLRCTATPEAALQALLDALQRIAWPGVSDNATAVLLQIGPE